MLYKAKNEAIKFYDDYSLIASAAKNKSKNQTAKGKGLRILTPKQLLQRLSIALAFILCISQKKSLKMYTIT